MVSSNVSLTKQNGGDNMLQPTRRRPPKMQALPKKHKMVVVFGCN